MANSSIVIHMLLGIHFLLSSEMYTVFLCQNLFIFGVRASHMSCCCFLCHNTRYSWSSDTGTVFCSRILYHCCVCMPVVCVRHYIVKCKAVKACNLQGYIRYLRYVLQPIIYSIYNSIENSGGIINQKCIAQVACHWNPKTKFSCVTLYNFSPFHNQKSFF